MVDQSLLTVFVALTAVAVVIQTGILVGFYVLSTKLNRQANQAVDATRSMLGPVQTAAENLRTISDRMTEYSASARRRVA
jgi:hypothetical protein